MIDTHSHIYLQDFEEDIEDILKRASDEKVTEIYLPNIDSSSIQPLLDLADRSEMCKPMMGLHPGSVKADYMEQLESVFEALNDSARHYYAVGEIGIDLYWDKTYIEEQKEVFSLQIEKAKEMGLPIVIHCRDAFDEVFEVLENHADEQLYGIFHCFTGNETQAQRAINLNMKLGIGGVVTFKNAGLDKVVQQLPLEHLVLETDAPYLAPAPFRGKRNEPSYLRYIVKRIADLHEISETEVEDITTINAKAVFERNLP